MVLTKQQDACKSKTIVMYSMPAFGHLVPMISIARELMSRGHRVIFLTARPFKHAAKIRALGLEMDDCTNGNHLVETRDTLMEFQEKLDALRMGLPHSVSAVYRPGGILNSMLDTIKADHASIEAKLRSLKPDLIIFDSVVGIPCLTQCAPRWIRIFSPFTCYLYSFHNANIVGGFGLRPEDVKPEDIRLEFESKRELRQMMREFFMRQNADDWPLQLDLVPSSPWLNFYLGPKELDMCNVAGVKPLPDVWTRLEHTIEEGEPRSESKFVVPEKLSKLGGKLIYFALGTLASIDEQLINRLLGILSKSPHRFIVSTGDRHEHIKLYDNMWGDSFLDQREILRKVDLFITHAGHNSVIEAFYYGVPAMIAMPVFADQFDLAQRIEDCGFGKRLAPYSCSENELLDAIQLLLADTTMARRMRQVSERMRTIKYHKIAANKIERVLRDADQSEPIGVDSQSDVFAPKVSSVVQPAPASLQ